MGLGALGAGEVFGGCFLGMLYRAVAGLHRVHQVDASGRAEASDADPETLTGRGGTRDRGHLQELSHVPCEWGCAGNGASRKIVGIDNKSCVEP